MTANILNTEFKAMMEGGLTDYEWLSLDRPQRANRVAYVYGRDFIAGIAEYDRIKEASKRKKG